jgi:hypothetical protein
MTMQNLIVLSADHHGDCLLGLSFDEKSKLLTVRYLLENIITRNEIVAQVQAVIEELFPYTRGHDFIDLVAIDNKVLANYIGDRLTVRNRAVRPLYGELPTSPKESLYRLKCAINEGNLAASGWLDQIEVALSAEANPDRIDGHLVQTLAFGVDKFLDSAQTQGQIGIGKVRR